jgi:phosphinothricin acetyltransferase
MAERIARLTVQYPWLVAEIAGQVAGYVYASQHRERAAYRWAVEVTAYIGANFQRRGLGRVLYTSLFDILREQNYYRAYAGITIPNPASVCLHEALGFELIGVYRSVGFKLGQWLDVGWWQLALQPPAADPPEPKPFAEVRDSAAVTKALAVARY